MNKTILLYSDKSETNIVIENMFKDMRKQIIYTPKLDIITRIRDMHPWIDENELLESEWAKINHINFEKNILPYIGEEFEQVILYGVDFLTIDILKRLIEEKEKIEKEKNKKIKIKVISDIYEGTMFYPRDRKAFLEVLKLLKEDKIYKLYFLKKSIADSYNMLGYKNVGYIMPNYILEKTEEEKLKIKESVEYLKNNKTTNIGVYVYDNEWYNNIYNTLSIGAFLEENGVGINYRYVNERALDFMNKHKIPSIPALFRLENLDMYIKEMYKNDIILELQFTNNFSLNYLMAAELGILGLIGNTSEFFEIVENKILEKYVLEAEDNPYENQKIIKEIIEDSNKKEEIIEQMKIWKEEYNIKQKENINKVVAE